MTTVGLVESYNDHHFLPTMRRVRCRGSVDRVTVKMLPGQILDDYADQGERLAMTFGAQDCRVVTGKRHGQVDLCFLTFDPLQQVVPPFPPADEPDLEALPVALREDGTPYRLRLRGNHVLVVGATGGGKGGVLWSINHALSPAIRSGLVQVWGIDPKGGMEFAMGQHLFARYCYGDPDEADPDTKTNYELSYAKVLEQAVEVTRAPSFLRMPDGCSLKGLGESRGDSLWRSPFEGLHDTAAPGSAEVADRLQEDAPQSAS